MIERSEDVEDVLLFLEQERAVKMDIEEVKHVQQVYHSDIKSLKWNPEISSKSALFSMDFKRVEIHDLNYNFHTIHSD